MEGPDNAHFVTKLGLIQGHLWQLHSWWRPIVSSWAQSMLNTPRKRFIKNWCLFFTPLFAGFAEELEAMSGQFTSSSKGDFRQSYQQVMNAIDAIVAALS